MIKYSIVTVVNNDDVYDKCLLQSIKSEKRRDIEFVPIFNYNNQFTASIALNYGLTVAKGEYVIICHQDVGIKPGTMEILDNFLTPDIMILGASGVDLSCKASDVGMWGGTKSKTLAVGTVYSSDTQSEPYWSGISELTKVHCVDECFFVVKKSILTRFDNNFNGFHFYGVDFCLQARKQGYDVHAASIPIIHYGEYSGSMLNNSRYWPLLRKLHGKWRVHFPELLTTHMHWDDLGEITSYIGYKLRSDDGLEFQVSSTKIKGLIND